MNIFALDELPTAAARYHCDRHVVKMILESAQLLSTAHHLAGDDVIITEGIAALRGQRICKPSHQRHPVALWTRAASGNYGWLHELSVALCGQYTKRYGKMHVMEPMLRGPLAQCPGGVPSAPRSAFAQAMPDQYKGPCSVTAYRLYYVGSKLHFARWAHSERPHWLDEYLVMLDNLLETADGNESESRAA